MFEIQEETHAKWLNIFIFTRPPPNRSVLSFSLVSYTLIYALKIYFITYTVFVTCQSGFILHKV